MVSTQADIVHKIIFVLSTDVAVHKVVYAYWDPNSLVRSFPSIHLLVKRVGAVLQPANIM
jgi:hypothetical protein